MKTPYIAIHHSPVLS